MLCQVCKTTGSMRKCKKCGNVYCVSCATKGKGHYPKMRASNVCPYCEAHNASESV